MRTFLSTDSEATRFWNVSLEGTVLTVQTGRRGHGGEKTVKKYSRPDAARKAQTRLIRQSLAEGFVEVVAQPGIEPLRQALEEALVLHPDDLAAHSAYADYLTEQGDPRGEFIQVQLALENEKLPARERKRLQKRESELLDVHRRTWLGALAGPLLDGHWPGLSQWQKDGMDVTYTFARGWLDSLETPNVNVEFSRTLARAPEVRLLRRLIVPDGASAQQAGTEVPDEEDSMGFFVPGDDVPRGSPFNYSPGFWPLASSPYLSNVRVLQIGQTVSDDEIGACHVLAGGAFEVVANLPRIEELYLFCHANLEELFALPTLGRLRVLQLYHQRYYPFHVLGENKCLTGLTHLLLHPHALEPRDEDAILTLDHLHWVLYSPSLSGLTHLRFRVSDAGDEGCADVVDSCVLERLKMLDLRHGCITDVGARILAKCPELKNLDLLDVSCNALTRAGVASLKKTGVPLKADDQYSAQDVEQRRYLYAGDCE